MLSPLNTNSPLQIMYDLDVDSALHTGAELQEINGTQVTNVQPISWSGSILNAEKSALGRSTSRWRPNMMRHVGRRSPVIPWTLFGRDIKVPSSSSKSRDDGQ
jgi:hypothetical protein